MVNPIVLLRTLPHQDESFSTFSGSTKDILLIFGMEWNEEVGDYMFPWQVP